MALMVQRLSGGGVRVVSGRAKTKAVQRRAAGMGLTGFSQRGRVGETNPGGGLSFGGILKGIGRGVGGFLERGPLGTLDAFAGGRKNRSPEPLDLAPAGCPSGFRRNEQGLCVKEGFVGTFERTVPGGDTGMLEDVSGGATVGAFGLPARVPSQVGTITRNDGTVGPILRCPRRMVLGFDNLCYPKAILGRRSKFRKHRLPTRPPVTGEDMRAIRRSARTKDRVKELAQDVGWKCSTKGSGGKRRK